MLEKMLIRIEIDLILDENRAWCLGKLEINFTLDFKIFLGVSGKTRGGSAYARVKGRLQGSK